MKELIKLFALIPDFPLESDFESITSVYQNIYANQESEIVYIDGVLVEKHNEIADTAHALSKQEKEDAFRKKLLELQYSNVQIDGIVIYFKTCTAAADAIDEFYNKVILKTLEASHPQQIITAEVNIVIMARLIPEDYIQAIPETLIDKMQNVSDALGGNYQSAYFVSTLIASIMARKNGMEFTNEDNAIISADDVNTIIAKKKELIGIAQSFETTVQSSVRDVLPSYVNAILKSIKESNEKAAVKAYMNLGNLIQKTHVREMEIEVFLDQLALNSPYQDESFTLPSLELHQAISSQNLLVQQEVQNQIDDLSQYDNTKKIIEGYERDREITGAIEVASRCFAKLFGEERFAKKLNDETTNNEEDQRVKNLIFAQLPTCNAKHIKLHDACEKYKADLVNEIIKTVEEVDPIKYKITHNFNIDNDDNASLPSEKATLQFENKNEFNIDQLLKDFNPNNTNKHKLSSSLKESQRLGVLIKQYKAINRLEGALNEEQKSPNERLENFKIEFKKSRSIIEQGRDSYAKKFLKAVASVALTVSIAFSFFVPVLWHTKGDDFSEQVIRELKKKK